MVVSQYRASLSNSPGGYFHSLLEENGIALQPLSSSAEDIATPSATEIHELAERSSSLEQRLASLTDSYETLRRRELELKEWRWVLREAGAFFDRVGLPSDHCAPCQGPRHTKTYHTS